MADSPKFKNPWENGSLTPITPTKDEKASDFPPPIKKEPMQVQLVSPTPSYTPLEISSFIVGVFFCCCIIAVLTFVAIKKINKKL